MARYNPTLGIFGNIKALFSEDAKNKNAINTNKADAINQQALNEDIMCELDDADRIASIEEALIELEEMITGGNE